MNGGIGRGLEPTPTYSCNNSISFFLILLLSLFSLSVLASGFFFFAPSFLRLSLLSFLTFFSSFSVLLILIFPTLCFFSIYSLFLAISLISLFLFPSHFFSCFISVSLSLFVHPCFSLSLQDLLTYELSRSISLSFIFFLSVYLLCF